MPVVLLVRHAESTANATHRLMGWTPGVHLTDRGREQAEGLAARLAPMPIGAVYASPLERCMETAAPLARARRGSVVAEEDLGEVRYGDWTGRTVRQVSRTALWRTVQATPSRARFPGGESLAETQVRAVRAVERVAARHPRAVVVCVTHGDVVRLALAHFAGLHLDLFQRLVVHPASVSAIAVGDGVPRILRVNDLGVLDDLAPAAPGRPHAPRMGGRNGGRKVQG